MEPQLSSAHQATYQHLFQHPMPHNLQWREVRSMLGAMTNAIVMEDDKGNLKIKRNGQMLILRRPRGKDLADKKELMQVRHFLERSERPVTPPAAAGDNLLVVIDHREAKIYRAEVHGSIPQRITPFDPHGYGRYLHYNEDPGNGQRKPERQSFYEAVAKTLDSALQVVVFGTGTGASSAMQHLLADLQKYHPQTAGRVVASIAVDEHHLSEDQLLEKAREIFAAV